MSARRENDTYTHVTRLPEGAELVATAHHGRVYLIRYGRGRRDMLTMPVEVDAARRLGERLIELAALAPSTKRSA